MKRANRKEEKEMRGKEKVGAAKENRMQKY